MDQGFPYYVQRKYYGCTYFALRLVYLIATYMCCPS